jgi:hypothetical protein
MGNNSYNFTAVLSLSQHAYQVCSTMEKRPSTGSGLRYF